MRTRRRIITFMIGALVLPFLLAAKERAIGARIAIRR
jgi:hypothetical protein